MFLANRLVTSEVFLSERVERNGCFIDAERRSVGIQNMKLQVNIRLSERTFPLNLETASSYQKSA